MGRPTASARKSSHRNKAQAMIGPTKLVNGRHIDGAPLRLIVQVSFPGCQTTATFRFGPCCADLLIQEQHRAA